MAIIISDSSNPNYDGKLSTSNGFYRVEAANLGCFNSTSLALSTTRYQNLTFANSGNCQGVVLALWTTSSNVSRAVSVQLQQAKTCTFTIASPGVVNIPGHGLSNYTAVQFTSTGTLPTGITANTVYYVRNATADSFNISSSFTGSLINFSGTPSGTHTCWITVQNTQTVGSFTIASPGKVNIPGHGLQNNQPVRFSTTGTLPTGITAGTTYYVANKTADDFELVSTIGGASINFSGSPSGTATCHIPIGQKTLSVSEIAGEAMFGTYKYQGEYLRAFNFDIPVAVDTTSNGWRFMISHATGSGTWNLFTSDGTNPFYATWCDNSVSFNDNDVLIVKDKVIIDKTATFGAVLGTGDTTNGVACVICSNIGNEAPDTVALLEWENPPSASYTLTVKGKIVMMAYSGMRIGTSTQRIPFSKRAIVRFAAPAAGTAAAGFITPTGSVNYTYGGFSSLFVYGEIPTYQYTTLKSDANTGQPNLVCNDNVDWVSGDQVVIGKQYTQGQGDLTIYTISSVSGDTITLTGNVASYDRKAGGTVIKLNSHGVKLENTASYSTHLLLTPANLIISGADLYNQMFNTSGTNYYYLYSYLDSSYKNQTLFEDVTFWTNSNSCSYLLANLNTPDGCLMQRCYGFRQMPAHNCVSYYTFLHKSGRMTIKDGRFLGQYAGTISTATNIRLTIENCSFENARNSVYFHALTGIEMVCKNNKYWGSGTVYTSGGAVYLMSLMNPIEISGNYYDYNAAAFVIGPSVSKNCVDSNSKFGSEYPNTIDIAISAPSALPDYIFKSATGITNFDDTYLPDMLIGGRYGFIDFNGTTNDDRMTYTFGKIQKTGSGLSDTTVHTIGMDKFAMRFEPLSGINRFDFSFDVPTGNIQGKTMTVAVWCKLKSANYYAGSDYQMPRLNVTYDGSTTIYDELEKNTDWQLLAVTFTPTTSSGKITVTLSAMTDATGSDRYVYWDDMAILYPAGYKLDLGGLDIWDNALPVLPPIATALSAKDVWTALETENYGTNTMGERVKKLLKKTDFLALK